MIILDCPVGFDKLEAVRGYLTATDSMQQLWIRLHWFFKK